MTAGFTLMRSRASIVGYPSARIGVGAFLDHQHETGRALDLADDGAIQASNEARRVARGGGEGGRVVERLKGARFAGQRLGEGRLPRLARSGQQDDARVGQRLFDRGGGELGLHGADRPFESDGPSN
jgi:hypothetical protein